MSTSVVVPPRLLPGGFRERGAQVTRLETFVDAAFAFAVTLLVISLDAIPASIPALIEALKGVPAFACSFAMIAMFWLAHANWSRRYGLDDTPSTLLSLVLVFLVLVYVYPLRIMFGSLFAWITQGWIPSPLRVASYRDILDMFVVYALAFATLSTCMALLYRHALRQRVALGLSSDEAVATYGHVVSWIWCVAVGLLSLTAALLMPAQVPVWLSGLPGLLYFLMSFTGLVVQRSMRRWRAREEARR